MFGWHFSISNLFSPSIGTQASTEKRSERVYRATKLSECHLRLHSSIEVWQFKSGKLCQDTSKLL